MMTLQVVTLNNIPKPKTLFSRLKLCFIWFCIFAMLYGTFGSGGSFLGRFFSCFLILSFLSTPVIIYSGFMLISGKDFKKIHEPKKQQLISQGYNSDFEALGILIDNQHKKIAFTLGKEPDNAYIFDFTDIRSWYSTTYNKETQYRNHQGAYAGSRTTALQHAITITTGSPEHPEFKFIVFSPNESNQWIARLDALINA